MIKKTVKLILISLTFLSGCATQKLSFETSTNNFLKGKTVAVMNAVKASDYSGLSNIEDIFDNNYYIGNIEFSGGTWQNPQKGFIEQSKYKKFSRIEEYEPKALSTVALPSVAVLEKAGCNISYVNKSASEVIEKFSAIQYYAKEEIDTDNMNRPMSNYKISYLFEKVQNDPSFSGVDYILLPVLVNYYSHNAGYFNTQEYGTFSGVRESVIYALVDIKARKELSLDFLSVKQVVQFASQLNIYDLQMLLQDAQLLLENEYNDKILNLINPVKVEK